VHELPVTESILRIASEHAEKAGASRIVAIHLRIGDMAGFINDSIQFYVDLLTPGTLAEGVTLHFHRIATRFQCWECEQEFDPEGRDWRCPHCGANGGKVIAGKEFFVESIEID
jgi:hydrogenase nickel incorporation protein HypA/HybF